ncbi:MFS general substrate transporter [Dacryopinax primogenitus]|uniref:MFS general substrate transporter n=1 Tax=Dacryopinax primogenitus (strain DJM 731) TaxID=1858805 RepID=M5FTS0_DACPD|nr:MFS general substrate transporter [Dacryopinax primogenitus]EJT99513.1 MFS general substrate transporter [Dacryopinax primogenitus]
MASTRAEDNLTVKQKISWAGYLWDTADLPPDERWLLFKVDASLLIFASLGYFLKNLDQSNVNNAFLSGMKEDLSMYGNELVTATSIWTVGYVIGQIPSNLLLTRISPRWLIPGLEIGWGLATLGNYAVKDIKALYALRFLVGLFESGFYPGIHYILGCWYTPRELSKRSYIFWVSGNLGTMFSGFLQSAAYTNLGGVNGLQGWRWLFIVDAVITLPIALFGLALLPALPWQQNLSVNYMTPHADTRKQEIEIARARMKAIGRKGSEPWSWAKLRRLLTGWHFWILPMLYVIWNNSSIQSPMGYWLKSFNNVPAPVPGVSFTVSQINLLPLPGNAIVVVNSLAWAWIADGPMRGTRWPFIYLNAVLMIIFAVTLRQLPIYQSITGHFVIYYLSNIAGSAGPMILNWIGEISSGDNEARAILVAMGNDLAYVVQAVAPNFVWKTTDFPAATKGMTWSIVLSCLLIFWNTVVLSFLWRDRRKAKQQIESDITDEPEESLDGKDTATFGPSGDVPRLSV